MKSIILSVVSCLLIIAGFSCVVLTTYNSGSLLGSVYAALAVALFISACAILFKILK